MYLNREDRRLLRQSKFTLCEARNLHAETASTDFGVRLHRPSTGETFDFTKGDPTIPYEKGDEIEVYRWRT